MIVIHGPVVIPTSSHSNITALGNGLNFDHIWTDVNIATMDPAIAGPYGAITDAAIAVKDKEITWIGPRGDLPASDAPITELDGAWMTPGLVDCHTHLVFGGNRATEFEARLEGMSYEEIALSGGGIVSTVMATREASLRTLIRSGRKRLEILRRGGVTTAEIKSGYGLRAKTEIRMLEAAKTIGEQLGIRVQRTFLGLHALPPKFKDDRAGYVQKVATDMLPRLAALGIVDAVDGFCEGIGFTPDEVRLVFDAAKKLGLPVKLHAEQLSNLGGAALAAEYGALSADHLEYLDEAGVKAMAGAGMTAVLLPGAFHALGETQKPPVDLLRKHAVPMALATDLNPGSSPVLSPTLIMNFACTLFGLTPEEALAGMTREGARALGMADKIGTLTVGKAADLAAWDIAHPAELAYWIGQPGPSHLYISGKEIKF